MPRRSAVRITAKDGPAKADGGPSKSRTLLHAGERDVEDERRVRRNGGRRAPAAVREIRRNDQAPLAADAHARYAAIPTRDHLTRADREAEARAAVELRPFAVGPARVVQPTRIDHRRAISSVDDGARADDEIGLREHAGRRGGRRRAVGAAGGARRDEYEQDKEASHGPQCITVMLTLRKQLVEY